MGCDGFLIPKVNSSLRFLSMEPSRSRFMLRAEMILNHRRDELYFVAAGEGEYVCGDTRQSFGPTDLLFAAGGVSHRFENFSDDLTLWGIFYGPDGGEAKLSENKMPLP